MPEPTSPPSPSAATTFLTRWRWLLRGVVVVSVAVSVVWMLRGVRLAELIEALQHATWWPLLLVAGINFVMLLGKAAAWRLLLGASYPVPLARLFSYTIASYAGSAILPVRAGEVIRVWLLRERDGVPIAQATAVAVAEKLLDIIAILVVVAPVPWLLRGLLPASVAWWLVGLAALVGVILVGLRQLAKRVSPSRWIARFAAKASLPQRPRVVAAVLGLLVLVALFDVLQIWLVLWVAGIDLPIAAALLLLLTINVTIAVPSTPGQLGTLELGALVGLHVFAAPEANGLVFALVYHAAQIIPVVTVGLLLHARLLLDGARLPPEPAHAPEPAPPAR